MIRTGFRLKNPLGLAYTMDEDDVLKTKVALRDLGHMTPPDYGLTAYPDRPMIEGILDFQKANGLKVDGVVKPGGPTERRLGAVQAASGAGRSRHTRGIAEGEWDWFYDELEIPRPGKGYPTDKGRDNLLEDWPALTFAPTADNRRGRENGKVRRKNDGRGGPSQVQVSALKGYPWHELLEGIGIGSDQQRPAVCRQPLTGPRSTGSLIEELGGAGPKRLPEGEDEPAAKRTDPAPVFPPPPSKPPRDEKPGREEYPAKPPIEPIDLSKPLPERKEPTIFIFPMPPEDLTKPVGIERNETEATKKQLDRIRDEIQAQQPDWEHVGGGRNRKSGKNEKEYCVPGPGLMFPRPGKEKGDGRRLSGFTDLTFKAKDSETYYHIQTVDIDRNCKPTKRELDNAERIHKRLKDAKDETHHIFLYRKRWQRKGC